MWLKRGEISSKPFFTKAVQDVLLHFQRRFIIVLAECCDVEEVGHHGGLTGAQPLTQFPHSFASFSTDGNHLA